MTNIDLEAIDRDGALQESFGRLTRTGFVGGAILLGAAAAGVAPDTAEGAAKLPARDVEILNYALTLEYLQASFYTEAQQLGALRGQTAQAARVVGAVERAHVEAFRGLLGSAAVARPAFDFQGTTENQRAFLKTAVALEDLAVAAYKGQAARVRSDAVLQAAVAIHAVEARHAAWMRHLFGIRPAASAFDEPRSAFEVGRLVASTRFIAARPKVERKATPRFTG